MDLEQIRQVVSKVHGGASYVVTYRKEVMTVDGEVAFKITSKPCRLGVRYSKLKQMKGLTPHSLPGNGHWIIDKYVYEDANGYKLRITNGAFGKPKVVFESREGDMIDRSRIIATKSSGYVPIVQCIKLENVISIKRKGEDL